MVTLHSKWPEAHAEHGYKRNKIGVEYNNLYRWFIATPKLPWNLAFNFLGMLRGVINFFKFSFMNRIVGSWNRLPHEIRRSPAVTDFNLNTFKILG